MRKLGCTAALLGCLGAGAASAPAADITPKAMLNLRPTRAGVEYDTPTDAAAIEQWPDVRRAARDGDRIEIVTDSAEAVVRRLLDQDAHLHELEVQRAGLAEAFVEITREAA